MSCSCGENTAKSFREMEMKCSLVRIKDWLFNEPSLIYGLIYSRFFHWEIKSVFGAGLLRENNSVCKGTNLPITSPRLSEERSNQASIRRALSIGRN